MNASNRSSLFTPTFFVALFAFGTYACASARTTPGSSESNLSSTSSSGQAGACASAACGADCTPTGSDEPFNCNVKGECVSAGADLECAASSACTGKACGVDCTPLGSDEPFNCDVNGECVAAGAALGCTTTEPECAGKACGVDCTPAGSDEPFNCSASGRCLAPGAELGCGACPEFLGDCQFGTIPSDLDGDGCIDGCKPLK